MTSVQDNLFRTILYSIGDAVITTDSSGRIRHMNHVAEKLTGWNEPEARGRALSEVFRIINEKTRRTVENPAEKVLQKGVIVGLANHTLLISKDGHELPIADSGAPIKTDSGEITFDAMTNNRPYKATKTATEAVEELKVHAGSQFDPQLVPVFLSVLKEGRVY